MQSGCQMSVRQTPQQRQQSSIVTQMRKGRNDSLVLDHSNDLIARLCRDFKCVWAIVDHFSGGFVKELRHLMKFHFSLNQSCFFHMCIDHNCVVCLFATYISAMKSHSPNQSNQLVFALFEGKKNKSDCVYAIYSANRTWKGIISERK